MSDVNKLGELKNEATGEVIAEMFGPPNALSNNDSLSHGLYFLSETIIRGLHPDRRGGGLGGEFGYGVEFENEVFKMFPFYWGDCTCGFDGQENEVEGPLSGHAEDCPIVIPNFRHKRTGLTIEWYKWIGRGMELSRKLSGAEWYEILLECYNSLPEEARRQAKEQIEYESTPEYAKAREEAYLKMSEEIREAVRREYED